MKHPEVIYRYANAGARADAFGLNLSASRNAFVLRFQKSMRVFGWPCADVEELERLLSNAALLRSLAFCGVALYLPAAQQWPAQKREKFPAGAEAQTGNFGTMSLPGNLYRCGHCGYEGPCYSNGFSAPWCKQCGRNSKLERISSESEL